MFSINPHHLSELVWLNLKKKEKNQESVFILFFIAST